MTSTTLLAELAKILRRAKFAAAIAQQGILIERLQERYATLCDVIVPASIMPTVLADPDDDHVLACALAARADAIISGDRHLLNLKHYQRIPILSPAAAVHRFGFP